jgi:hypothetical protein
MGIDIKRNYDGYIDRGPTKEEKQAQRDKLMKEFLAKGGKIERCPPGIAQGAQGALGGRLQYSADEIISQDPKYDPKTKKSKKKK